MRQSIDRIDADSLSEHVGEQVLILLDELQGMQKEMRETHGWGRSGIPLWFVRDYAKQIEAEIVGR